MSKPLVLFTISASAFMCGAALAGDVFLDAPGPGYRAQFQQRAVPFRTTEEVHFKKEEAKAAMPDPSSTAPLVPYPDLLQTVKPELHPATPSLTIPMAPQSLLPSTQHSLVTPGGKGKN